MAEELDFSQTESEITDEMENMYLNFFVGEGVYGIEIRYVLQIIGMQKIEAMPEMPMYMKGFINLRGNIIPVVSMRERFGQFEDPYNERTCIIITQVGDREVGLIVDAIKETITIEPEQVSPQPAATQGMDNAYIKGIAKLTAGDVSILIDVQRLFGGYDIPMY
ncbi:MAG: chemotaxis protein CheW [Oscillospiraceae bacterium]|nr:chemotaxis protein CheW [Oscillospiraceae bacterium]